MSLYFIWLVWQKQLWEFPKVFRINARLFFFILAFVGGDPKPQHLERTRVVGLEHTKSNQRFKDHRRHRTNSKSSSVEESKKTSETKPKAELEAKFKLWADGPNFDTSLRQNVVALVGRTAYLTCRVFDRGNKTVILAFIRHLMEWLMLVKSHCIYY